MILQQLILGRLIARMSIRVAAASQTYESGGSRLSLDIISASTHHMSKPLSKKEQYLDRLQAKDHVPPRRDVLLATDRCLRGK